MDYYEAFKWVRKNRPDIISWYVQNNQFDPESVTAYNCRTSGIDGQGDIVAEIIAEAAESGIVIDNEDGTYSIPDKQTFTVSGYEAREFVVRSGGTSARINVPVEWQGKKVLVIRLE